MQPLTVEVTATRNGDAIEHIVLHLTADMEILHVPLSVRREDLFALLRKSMLISYAASMAADLCDIDISELAVEAREQAAQDEAWITDVVKEFGTGAEKQKRKNIRCAAQFTPPGWSES